jgi:hypothetical protein
MSNHERDMARRMTLAREVRIEAGDLAVDGKPTKRSTLHREPDSVPFDVLRYRADATTRGFIRYVKLRTDRRSVPWICDECYKAVSPSSFMTHAEDNHL